MCVSEGVGNKKAEADVCVRLEGGESGGEGM